MTTVSRVAAACAAAPSPTSASAGILQAARLLLPDLERGRRIDAGVLRSAMETAFGASDAAGAWDWKSAYDACEAATVLFLRKYGKALFRKADSPASRLAALTKIAGVDSVTTDFANKTVTVSYDDTKARPEQLAKATGEAGYPSTVQPAKPHGG